MANAGMIIIGRGLLVLETTLESYDKSFVRIGDSGIELAKE
jgi:hypothetical protein